MNDELKNGWNYLLFLGLGFGIGSIIGWPAGNPLLGAIIGMPVVLGAFVLVNLVRGKESLNDKANKNG